MMTGTSPTLPIKQLLDMNPPDNWVRPAGDLSKLVESIQESGLQIPLLVTPEGSIVDGFRRLYALNELGWDSVPIRQARSWEIFTDYMQLVRQHEDQGWTHEPMTWLQYGDLWLNVISELYRTYRYVAAMRARTATRSKGVEAARPPTSHYNTLLATIYGFRNGNQVKTIRDLYAAYRRCIQGRDPEIAAAATSLARSLDHAEGRGFRKVVILLQDLSAGRIAPSDAVREYEFSLQQQRIGGIQRPVDLVHAPDDDTRTPLEVVDRLVAMVNTASIEAQGMDYFDKKLSLKAAEELVAKLARSVNRLNRLRRRLEAHIAAPTQPTK